MRNFSKNDQKLSLIKFILKKTAPLYQPLTKLRLQQMVFETNEKINKTKWNIKYNMGGKMTKIKY